MQGVELSTQETFPQVALAVNNPPANAGGIRDLGSIPEQEALQLICVQVRGFTYYVIQLEVNKQLKYGQVA